MYFIIIIYFNCLLKYLSLFQEYIKILSLFGVFMKKWIFAALHFVLICYFPLQAEIIKTDKIEETIEGASDQTLVLFNIAEVLMDTEMSLGTQAWRKYVRSRLTPQLHDELTLFVFKHVPPKTPEPETASLIASLQEKGVPVLAFTSRGRHEWYSSQIQDIDSLTENALRQIGIDFANTHLPSNLAQLDSIFGDYYHAGIIYATNSYEKGEMLTKLVELTHYLPNKIIFVDDKADSLKTVEKAANEMKIPFTGYAYSRTSKQHANFDPMIAHIQLDWLVSYGKLLSDQEAAKIKEEQFAEGDPEAYFLQIIRKWKGTAPSS